MKISKQGFAPLLIIILIALIVGGGAYYFSKKSEAPGQVKKENNTQTTTSATSTSNTQKIGWKTYSNSEYGFEFKYPNNWILSENANNIKNIESGEFVSVISPEHKKAVENGSYGPAATLFDFTDFIVSYCININTDCARGGDWVGSRNYTGISDMFSDKNPFNKHKEGEIEVGGTMGYITIAPGESGIYEIMIQTDEGIYLLDFPFTPDGQAKLSGEQKQIVSSFRFTSPTNLPNISNITPNHGPVGTKIEIIGKNLAGLEGDLNLWFENVAGVKGILYADSRTESNTNRILATIPSRLCQTDESYRGLPCQAWLNLVPGTYKVYTSPWGNKSNVVQFTITAN